MNWSKDYNKEDIIEKKEDIKKQRVLNYKTNGSSNRSLKRGGQWNSQTLRN